MHFSQTKNRVFWLWIFVLLGIVLSGCASQRARTQPPLYGNPNQPDQNTAGQPLNPPPPVSNEPMGPQPVGPNPGGPMGPNPEIPVSPPPQDLVKKSNEPHVALVVGGAGVASFATVGVLKRFEEEGIAVDFIVTSGWPTLFSLGYGFFRSVHDLEWFAMRLGEKDFNSGGIFELSRDYTSPDRISSLIDSSFPQKDLTDTRVPVIISATNTELGAEVLEKGDWKVPLLKTMSVPGLFRPYPTLDANRSRTGLNSLDVEEALRRGARTVVAIEMYDDYLRKNRKDGDAGFRQWYLTGLRKSLKKELPQALLVGKIQLDKAPSDFAAKRLAIFAGYKEAARLAKQLRTQLNN
jgi:predicted acylesterase/phospholipase RssA